MLHRLRHALPAVAAGVVSLVVPLLAAPDATVGTAGSVTARAAQATGAPNADRRYPVGSPVLEAARGVAVATWGVQPCGGAYEIAWARLDPGTNATASWRNPRDAWANPGANFDCRIELSTQAEFDFSKLCTVLAHEIGHLAGQQHDARPGELMSAYYTAPLPSCKAASPEAAPAPEPKARDRASASRAAEARRPLRRAKARYRTVRRCTVVVRDGRRVKRCRTLRLKAAKASRRSAR